MVSQRQQYRSAAFDAAASDITIVAAGAGESLHVHAYVITADVADGTVRFEDSAGGTALTGQMNMVVDGTLVAPFSEIPWFVTSVNNDIVLEATTTGASGHIIYSIHV